MSDWAWVAIALLVCFTALVITAMVTTQDTKRDRDDR